MVDSSRLLHILKFLAPLLLFFWSISYLSGGPKSTYHQFLRQFRDEKKLFVADFLQHEIDGYFSGEPIAGLCSTKTWTEGFVLSCEPSPGGIGEVKNAHLNCIRIAIEMGAELILPEIVRRSDKDIAVLIPPSKGPTRGTSLEYFFDRQHLIDSLSTYCPQMKLHGSIHDLHDVPNMLVPVKLSLASVTKDVVNGTVLAKPNQLGKQLEEYLAKQSPPRQRKYPFRVHLQTSPFTFPTAFDPPDFATNFGRILRIREDARRLAASALFNMEKAFNLRLDPRNGIKNESFIGVHLRTEKDVAGKFPAYAEQAANYLNYIVQNHMNVVFLATGATTENITSFKERAEDFNMSVVTKHDVLEGDDLYGLKQMTFDQRALVDMEIMLRAGLIAGTTESSFAWNLALRRKNTYGKVGKTEAHTMASNIQYEDHLSVIFGNTVAGQSMQLTIWP